MFKTHLSKIRYENSVMQFHNQSRQFNFIVTTMNGDKFRQIITNDGKYEISFVSKETLQDAVSVIQQAFFVDESVSIATRVGENPQAVEELSELCVRAIQDGISLIAIEKATRKPVAAFINKLQVPPANPEEENYFEAFVARCKHPSSRALMNYMIEMEKMYDVFEEKNVECAVEVMFIGTLRPHRGKQLGTKMWEITMEIGRKLANGEDVRLEVAKPLNELVRPECVTSLATSNATARIAEKFGFEIVLDVPFDRFHFDGKAFSERIGPETKSSTLVFKRFE